MTSVAPEFETLLEQWVLEHHSPRRLVVRRGARRILVPVEEIEWIESEGNYARLHLAGTTYLIRETLTSLEERLRRPAFVRVQRSILVNLEEVGAIRSDEVVLRSGQALPVSRNFRAHLHDALELA